MCASISETEDYNQFVEAMDKVFKELNDLCDNGFEFNNDKIYVDW